MERNENEVGFNIDGVTEYRNRINQILSDQSYEVKDLCEYSRNWTFFH